VLNDTGYEALSLQLESEVQSLTQVLWSFKIGHRWTHRGNDIVLWVLHPGHVHLAQKLLDEIRLGRNPVPRSSARALDLFLANVRRAPVTLATIALAVFIFGLTSVAGVWQVLAGMTYYPLVVTDQGMRLVMQGAEWYRMFTPAWLHFGWLHLIFNCLWVWEFGRRLEAGLGSLLTLFAILAIALVANVAQAELSEPAVFGGLSGVVYGLLALSWIGGMGSRPWCVAPPNTIVYFMLGWLLLGLSGLVDMLGFGSIANHAHVGGLLGGVTLAFLLRSAFALRSRS
jgi:GlpG protein